MATTPKTVLVVDDYQPLLTLIARQLDGMSFKVATASHAEAALRWCEDNGPPDLLLTDVCMPDVDGPQLYLLLSDRFPSLPVIFMSATARYLPGQKPTPLLEKPFSWDRLQSMVETALLAEQRSVADPIEESARQTPMPSG
jgi:DNA-binding NtrC family response regulator